MLDLDADCGYVVLGDNADVLPKLPDRSFQLIYIDPPFNTGRSQQRLTLTTRRSDAGTRRGFQGRRYETVETGRSSYLDEYDDYAGFIAPRMEEARRLLTEDGTLYFHIDYREAHYCKILLDGIFGRDCFLNEIIWAYDYGGRPSNRWPAKHDTILVYVREPSRHYFDREAVDRIPYMAPGLVTREKAERGKLPTDVWWHTIVPLPAKKSSTHEPGADEASTALRTTPSGFWLGSPVFSAPLVGTIVCHQTSVGSFPFATFSGVTSPGAM